MTVFGADTRNAPRFDDVARHYDGLLVLSFGGPEGRSDVIPFLENVTRGRNVPRDRLDEVAEHYYHFNGISPINAQNRELIALLEDELRAHRMSLPIYFGNRNWHPFVTDTVRQMRDDGVRRALVFVTSAFSSYSGCRQYREDMIAVIETAPALDIQFDKIRVFYNHPGFVEPMAEKIRQAVASVADGAHGDVDLIFTAHSIPVAMARGCRYEAQLREACELVAMACGVPRWRLAYQSRSGSPRVPWLEPDVLDAMTMLHSEGRDTVVLAPIGFISDHMEVLFDLDEEAAERAAELGMRLARAQTVGTHPRFVSMIRELSAERMTDHPARRALGRRGPNHDICPIGCCQRGETRPPLAGTA